MWNTFNHCWVWEIPRWTISQIHWCYHICVVCLRACSIWVRCPRTRSVSCRGSWSWERLRSWKTGETCRGRRPGAVRGRGTDGTKGRTRGCHRRRRCLPSRSHWNAKSSRCLWLKGCQRWSGRGDARRHHTWSCCHLRPPRRGGSGRERRNSLVERSPRKLTLSIINKLNLHEVLPFCNLIYIIIVIKSLL